MAAVVARLCETQALQDAVDRGETATVKELYKRYKDFFFSDDKPFYGKCAYCARHLKIDTTTGYLYGITERGRMCIQVYGLNVCDGLVDERRKACSGVRDSVALYISNCIKKDLRSQKVDDIEQEIEEIRQEKCSYWLARKTTLLEAQSEVMSKFPIL
jgi:hypothetical protein